MSLAITRRALLGAAAAPFLARTGFAAAAGLDALLTRRRMVRRFTGDAVSAAAVERILAAAVRAPSAGNTQPWAFVVVREPARRRALGEAASEQRWLAGAPVVIAACADRPRSRARYGARGDRYALIDTAFASLLILLQVVEEGLGACFVGAFDDARVAEILGLPSAVQPVALIPVGRPAERPGPMPVRPPRAVRHDERWGGTPAGR